MFLFWFWDNPLLRLPKKLSLKGFSAMAEQVGTSEVHVHQMFYLMVLSDNNGEISTIVGPKKQTLDSSAMPVEWNGSRRRYEVTRDAASTIKSCPVASQNWYISLKNPAQGNKHPNPGSKADNPPLEWGKTVNIHGPVSFAPFPFQEIEVIEGHRLRTDQFIIVRVEDADAAKAEWKKAVLEPAKIESSGSGSAKSGATIHSADGGTDDDANVEIRPDEETPTAITNGQLFVIKGTTTSLYMPQTGMRVIKDEDGNYVRNAASLESLEQCVLRDQNGKKRYEHGPQVVFPTPTEEYVPGPNGERKFRAIELTPQSGVHVKVLCNYEDNGTEYKEGEELWITGDDTKIYWPRPEHAVIRYGEERIHYAVVIPAGQGRYVLNKETGAVDLETGPNTLLLDPRQYRFVRRTLKDRQVKLWFPNSERALSENRKMREASASANFFEEEALGGRATSYAKTIGEAMRGAESPLARGMESLADFGGAGAELQRKVTFTKPKMLELDAEYDGAVPIQVFTGWAVKVIDSDGNTEVVVGPQTRLLRYDETLEVLSMSTSTPKSTEHLHEDVYLRVRNNQVSDEITAQTRDLVTVTIPIKLRVDFTEEMKERWFNVQNYVKLLTDHLRSLVCSFVKRHTIAEFMNDHIAIVRDAILGVASSKTSEKGEGQKPSTERPGRTFEENGMRVYDVEVEQPRIDDHEIHRLLIGSQQDAMRQTLALEEARRQLAFTEANEDTTRKIAQSKAETAELVHSLQLQTATREHASRMAQLEAGFRLNAASLAESLNSQATRDEIQEAELTRQAALSEQEMVEERAKLQLDLERLGAEVKGVVDKAQAIGPDLVAALQRFADNDLAAKAVESMAPMTLLGGKSALDFLQGALAGTPIAAALNALKVGNNG